MEGGGGCLSQDGLVALVGSVGIQEAVPAAIHGVYDVDFAT